MDVATIVARVQTELEDVGLTWATEDLIIRRLSIANEDVCTRLESQDLSFQIVVVVISAVPAQTPDLSAYQSTGGVLYGLVVPKVLEWRLVGQNDEQWQDIPYVQKVEDTNIAPSGQPVASDEAGIESYEWRTGVLYISPSNQPCDIRVRGEFLPPLLQNDSDQQIIGLTNSLVYRVCWKISASRSELSNITADFLKQYEESIDNFEVMQIKQKQNQTQRLGGRRSAMGSGEFAGGLMPPTA